MAKVDAEAENSKSTAQAQGVTSYPTIKYFHKGSKTPEAYEGGRTEEALVTFLNGKAGTHRVIGGGLDAKAGTIDILDSILSKLPVGKGIASITEEITKAAKDIKSKYADYYVKVATKMSTSQDYVEKEIKRLEGILKKGGLAPAKKDDVTQRANILKKFVQGTEAKVREEL